MTIFAESGWPWLFPRTKKCVKPFFNIATILNDADKVWDLEQQQLVYLSISRIVLVVEIEIYHLGFGYDENTVAFPEHKALMFLQGIFQFEYVLYRSTWFILLVVNWTLVSTLLPNPNGLSSFSSTLVFRSSFIQSMSLNVIMFTYSESTLCSNLSIKFIFSN